MSRFTPSLGSPAGDLVIAVGELAAVAGAAGRPAPPAVASCPPAGWWTGRGLVPGCGLE